MLHVIVQGNVEISCCPVTKTPNQPVKRLAVFRKCVGLLLSFNLEPVFDSSQEVIGCLERASLGLRDQLELRQDRQCFQRTRFLQECVPRSMEKLQRLDNEF